MIARVIVNFCIFSLLKCNIIFGKHLQHDTYGVKQLPLPSTLKRSVPGLVPEIYVSFHFF